jgi:Protein of unknown function (DUF3102)
MLHQKSAEHNTPALALLDLAQAIDREHQAAIGATRTAIEHAVTCGKLLVQAKGTLPHGEWLYWLEANTSVSTRTAQVYMRLARELPKLSEENAQRAALLTIRDAIVAVSQHTASIAALPPPAQDRLIERAEASGERLATARHHVQRDVALAAMELAKPPVRPVRAGPDRRMRLLKNSKTRQLCLTIGPNLAGLYVNELVREREEREDYRAEKDAINELTRSADELERQAAALRLKAKQKRDDLQSWVKDALVQEHGPIRPFIETVDYSLADGKFDELSRLPEQEAIAALLASDLTPVKRGYWGDIRHSRFVTLEHATEWANIGNEHGLPQAVVDSLNPAAEGAP